MASKRILIFSTAYFPFVGGAEIAVKEITDRLVGDFEFDLVCAKLDPKLPGVEKVGNVTVYRIGIGIKIVDKLLVPFVGTNVANKLNKKSRYDCFWIMMAAYTGGAAYIHNILHPNHKVPIILTLQEGDSESHLKYRWAGLIDLSWRLALKRTNFLTAISNYLLERAKRLGYKGKAELIPNGVDIEKFENKNPKSNLGNEVVLITTSRLVEKNAIGDVIEAMKFMPGNFKFRIIGTGSLEESLKLKVKNLKLEDRVEFVGEVPHYDISKYLHEADIFVRPSLSEGMGNSFIEAMAAGIPVIATPVGGIPDFLIDGETGFFVEPKSPRLIAFQVEKITHDRVLRDKVTINAKRLVTDKYSWDLIASEMKENVFDKVAV